MENVSPDDELDLDDIHEIIETLEYSINALRAEAATQNAHIYLSDFSALCSVITELNDWDKTAYGTDLSNKLGIAPSLVSKFLRFLTSSGEKDIRMKAFTALKVAERALSYAKSLESEATDWRYKKPKMDISELNSEDSATKQILHFSATTWAAVPKTSEIQEKISLIAELLDSLILNINSANLPPSEQALSEIEKQQLIAVLETALQMLQAPLVEKNLLEETSDLLGNATRKAAEKSVQEALETLGKKAIYHLIELIKLIPWD